MRRGDHLTASERSMCVRCGLIRRTNSNRNTQLCMDCRTVTSDLGEFELWTTTVPRLGQGKVST